MTFVIQRAASAAVIIITSFYLAKTLGPATYGAIGFFLYLSKTLLVGHLGSVSGYIFCTYNKPRYALACRYPLHYLAQLALVSVIAMVIGLFLGKVYFYSGLAFLLLTPYHAIEPTCRVDRRFYVSLLPDLVMHLTLLGLVAWHQFDGNQRNVAATGIMQEAVWCLLASYPLLILVVYRSRAALSKAMSAPSRKPLVRYARLAAYGLPLYASTLAFTLYLATDRLFLERSWAPESLGLYLFAFQLANGACLLVSSSNFVSVIDIGEVVRQGTGTRQLVRRQIGRALLLAIPSYCILVVASFVLEHYFMTQYSGLSATASALGVGLTMFYVAGSVTPIIFYRQRQVVLFVGMIVAVVLSICHNCALLYWGGSVVQLSCCTAAWLFLYATCGIAFAFFLNRPQASSDDVDGSSPLPPPTGLIRVS